jgi:hypothetical protein
MGLANPALLIFQALKLVENRRFNPEWFDEFGIVNSVIEHIVFLVS